MYLVTNIFYHILLRGRAAVLAGIKQLYSRRTTGSSFYRWLNGAAIFFFLAVVVIIDYLTEYQPLQQVIVPFFYILPVILAVLISRFMAVLVAGAGAVSAGLITAFHSYVPHSQNITSLLVLVVAAASGFALYIVIGLLSRATALKEEAEARALRLQTVFLGTASSLNSVLHARHPHTARHSKNVAVYAAVIAREMGLSVSKQETVYFAALLHDVGKIVISEQPLKKPGRLSPRDWDEIKRHPIMSYRILRDIPELEDVAIITLYHHEHWDGGGYPCGLKGEQIPLGARILCVADSFDAMISERPYKTTLAPQAALSELKQCAGGQFDPVVVDAFVRWFERENPAKRPDVLTRPVIITT